MNRPSKNSGIQPLLPNSSESRILKSKQDFAEYIATTQYPPSLYGGGALFAFRSNQDFKDSTQVIAEIDQGGLGLPDRDYYLKDDAKSQELRKAYLAHVAKMFELVGDAPADAANEAATVMRIETALAKGQMTRVERRDPPKLYHKMRTEELQKAGARFRLEHIFHKNRRRSRSPPSTSSRPTTSALNEEIDKESLPDWKIYLRWHAVHEAANDLSSPLVKENFNFYGKTLRGRQEFHPAGSAAPTTSMRTSGKPSGRPMSPGTSAPKQSKPR